MTTISNLPVVTMIATAEVAALSKVIKSCFNDDHNIRFRVEAVETRLDNGLLGYEPTAIICEIYSVAGVLEGRGNNIYAALCDALEKR